MRLLSLQAVNFKKLRFDSPIQLSDGLTLIAGLNESGKSTVLDAILYALFGRVTHPQKAKNEDLVAYGTNEAIVTLDFEVGERKVRVTRRVHKTKPARANLEEFSSRGATQLLATGQEKVNEEIVRMLGGVTYHEIVSSTVVAQKELNKLIELNKDDRRKTINVFLNLDSFNTALAELGEERRDLEGTGARLGRVQTETEKLALMKQELLQFNQNREEKAKLEQQNVTLSETVLGHEANLKEKDQLYSLLQSYESARRKTETLTLQLAGKNQTYNDYASRSARLKKEEESLEKEIAKYEGFEKAEAVLAEIQARFDSVKSRRVELTAAENGWRNLQQEVRHLDQKFSSVDTAKLRKQAEQLHRPILPYAIGSIALLAGAVLAFAEGLVLVAAALVIAGALPAAIVAKRIGVSTAIARQQSMLGDLKYLDEKRRELAGREEALRQQKAQLDAVEIGLAGLCEKLPNYGDVFSSRLGAGILEATRSVLENAEKDRQSREAFLIKLQTIRNEIGRLPSETVLVELEREIKSLEEQLNKLVLPALPEGVVFTSQLLSTTLAARDELGRQIATAQSAVNQNTQRIRELDKYLTEHADVVSKVELQEEAVRKLDRQLKVVRRAIDGIQATAESLRNRVRPSVQGYMGAILPALTSSRYRAAVLDENYTLQVWDPEAGEYRPRDVYSGGTEDQFLLAMRLAFALALMPEVKGQKPEFVFLDEPLGSSDEVRRSGIIEYLTLDLSKKFRQIFIISHVGGLEEHVRNTILLDDGRVVRAEQLG